MTLFDAFVAFVNERIVCCFTMVGNRNFEGRVHSEVRAAFLASPPLVVAYALAGTVNIDFEKEPIGACQYFPGSPKMRAASYKTELKVSRRGGGNFDLQLVEYNTSLVLDK